MDILSAPAFKNPAKIVHRTDAPAYGKRNEYLFRRACNDILHDPAVVRRGCDIKKCNLIRALRVISLCNLHRVARIAQVNKVNPLTTRPAWTSRHGIILLVSIYFAAFIASLQSERAVIQGAACQ